MLCLFIGGYIKYLICVIFNYEAKVFPLQKRSFSCSWRFFRFWEALRIQCLGRYVLSLQLT